MAVLTDLLLRPESSQTGLCRGIVRVSLTTNEKGWLSMTTSRRFLLEGLNCQASIGIYDAERQAKQMVLIDVELLLCDGTEPQTDSVDTTIDYDVIRDTIHNLVGAKHYDLQETLARRIFDALLTLPEVASVRVRTAKPSAYDDCKQIAYELSNLPS
jgi:dihydroneopterin aldolase